MKTLKCKTCGEEVEVPEKQLSVLCTECAEKEWAEKEFDEQLHDATPPEKLHDALADARFRKAYLHQRALNKARRV